MEKKKVKDFVFKNIGYFLIVAISVAFVFLQQVIFPEVDKSIFDMIRDGAVIIVISTAVSFSFSLQGFVKGVNSNEYLNRVERHSLIKMQIAPIQGKLQEHCDIQNAINLAKIRTDILSIAGLEYADCFDEKGRAKDKEFEVPLLWWVRKFDKDKVKNREKKVNYKKLAEQKKAFKKARKSNPAKLTVKKLLFKINKSKDKYDYGDDLNTALTKKGFSSMFISIVMAIIVGYYGYPLLSNWNTGLFIWSCIQVLVFIVTGVVKMYMSYLYVLNNYCGSLDEIIGELHIFKTEYLPQHEEAQKSRTEEIAVAVKKYIDENYKVEEEQGN